MTERIHLSELAWPEVRALLDDPAKCVLLLPMGAVEPHGPHAALSTDTIISVAICERAARMLLNDPEVIAVVAPPVGYGVTRYAAAFPGTIGIREETLETVVLDICRSAIETGFRRIAVVNNHFEPEQVSAVRRAIDELDAVPGARVGHLDLTRRRYAARLGDEFRSGSCHAGRYETSLVLAERPEVVDSAAMAALEPLPVDMPRQIAAGHTDFLAMGMADAYCGSPAMATAAEGEELFATLAQMLVDLVRDLKAV